MACLSNKIRELAEYRKQIVTTSIVAIVLALSIGIGIYYAQPQLSGTGTTRTTSTSNTNYPQSAETTSSASGLELLASLNTTSIQHGQAIQVTVEVFNTLTKTNNVSTVSNWYLNVMNPSLPLGPINSSSLFGFLCFTPANYVVFKGYYESGNLSSVGTPLQLYGPQITASSCHKSNFDLYMFQPYSSEANVSLTSPPSYNYTINMQASSAILSYCNIPPGAEGVCLTGFSPGVYTIAAGDEWGQIVLLHFVVTSSQTVQQSTATSQSTSFPDFAASTNSTLGLELKLSTNSTNIQSAQTLNVTVSVWNALATVHNVSRASDWAAPLQNLRFSQDGGQCDQRIKFAIFNGYYDQGNASYASNALFLSQPGVGPACLNDNPPIFIWQPSSDVAKVSLFGGQYGYMYVNDSNPISGYYPTNSVNATGLIPPTPLPSGTYTLIAGDEWGQIAILHFIVSSNSISSNATTTTSYPPGCDSLGCTTSSSTYTVTTSIGRSSASSNSSESSQQTSLDTTFTSNFYYWITINYSGSWRLVYWGWNGRVIFPPNFSCAPSISRFCLLPYNATLDNVRGNILGSGNYTFRVVTYGIGYVQNTLCANATKTDSSQKNLTLTLTVLGTTSNTTASNPTAVACGTYGV